MIPATQHQNKVKPFVIIIIAILFVSMIGLACKMPTSEGTNGTQVALDVQSTQLAQRETDIALTEIAVASGTMGENNKDEPDLQATLVAQQATHTALEAQATLNAQQQAQQEQVQGVESDPQPTATTQLPIVEPSQDYPDFETWMRSSAKILLYEDMAGDFSVYRYIKNALDAMGVGYIDVKDALGHYKEQLLSGGPGGEGWDLIISGKELRTTVQGEFYVYLNDALNQGSSAIIEEWDVDSIGGGKLSTILSRCGVELHKDWLDIPMNE